MAPVVWQPPFGPGASEAEIFGFFEKCFFGHIFFLSKRTDMFAIGFGRFLAPKCPIF